jgi:N-acetylmuramoyl-L-alanine amidase
MLPRLLAALSLAAVLYAAPAEQAEARAPARPDRALYYGAVKARSTLEADARLKRRSSEWEKVIGRFRVVVSRYPQSGYCDDALFATGDLYRRMAANFRDRRYLDEANESYIQLAKSYPYSRLGESALYSAFEIARGERDRRKLEEAGRRYLAAYPDHAHSALVRATLERRASIQPSALPSPPPKGLSQVFSLRSWSGETSTRVVIGLERQVAYRRDRIQNPDRLWIDLEGTRLHPNLTDNTFPVGDGLLKQVRVGQYQPEVVRVVLDFKEVSDYKMFYLSGPPRLVIDVIGDARRRPGRPAAVAAARLADSPVEPLPTPNADEARLLEPQRAQAAALPTPAPPPKVQRQAARGPAGLAGNSSDETEALVPSAAFPPRPTPEPEVDHVPPEASPQPTAPLPPQPNRSGSMSIVRQLGLGARRIVIDPGHGGHDPGTIGRSGLQEKDLVLDVALRLERLLRRTTNMEVILTRRSDVYVPLEERTAIANSRGADLFLSIHGNSSRSPSARGVETYYLNFAMDAHAEEVAARENAISRATLRDLTSLVKAITQNAKIEESRDFAASVQQHVVQELRTQHGAATDRGVRRAPFYVLLGANMPSVLAEISFISHPNEEKLLRSPEYRDAIAQGLRSGMQRYLEALNANASRRLTTRESRIRVSSRGATHP